MAAKATVILFKTGGKYYTEEHWTVPDGAIGPYDMADSPDFRRISGGPVLVVSQEPWGYPFLLVGAQPPLVPSGPDVHTERIQITRDANGEATYSGETPDGSNDLSGFAGDIAHEVAYSLMEGTEVERAEITVRWQGEY